MTLFRQLTFAITFLIVCLMAANLVVSVYNARGYMFEQMQVHAQDTATSLGLTISHAAKEKDLAQINSFIDVIFDRGYYRHIFYRSLTDDSIIQRELPIDVEGVPAWFINLLDLPEPSGRAEVVSGWFRLGELLIVSHPGYAYQDLWRIFREQLWLFFFTAVLCYAVTGIGLRYLLRPLRKVEDQAEAICRREFPIQEDLPHTPELRRMVVAMNRMVQKIKSMFQEQVELTESLHRQAHLDSVTELSNRRDFDARYEAFIKSEQGGSAGMLLLLQVGNMAGFNDSFGRDAGDQCLRSIAKVLKQQTQAIDGAILSRRAGADFCAFVPLTDAEEGKALAERLFQQVQSINWFGEATDLLLHLGVAFDESVTLDSKLLSRADLALRQAQQRNGRAFEWQSESNTSVSASRSASEWHQLLQNAIKQRQLEFFVQPVFARDGKTITKNEVLCRLRDGEQLLNAGVFLPMVERFAMAADIDRLVIELLAERFTASSGPQLNINLSSSSIQRPEFVSWLVGFLRERPAFAQRLLLELPEQALVVNEAAVREFALSVEPFGAGLCLDHFGVAASAFHYLQSLPLQALKIDRCFISGLQDNADNQFFVKSLRQIARSCDVDLLAEGVETEQEWQAILELGLDGGQGYYLGKPAASQGELV